jgi:hypothetical protein
MLPTIDEFRADAERCKSGVQRRVMLSIGSLMALILLSVAARALLRDAVGSAAEFLPAAVFVAGVPLMLYGFWRADRYAARFATLACPHCAATLATSSGIVIASRNCPSCGKRVIDVGEDEA